MGRKRATGARPPRPAAAAGPFRGSGASRLPLLTQRRRSSANKKPFVFLLPPEKSRAKRPKRVGTEPPGTPPQRPAPDVGRCRQQQEGHGHGGAQHRAPAAQHPRRRLHARRVRTDRARRSPPRPAPPGDSGWWLRVGRSGAGRGALRRCRPTAACSPATTAPSGQRAPRRPRSAAAARCRPVRLPRSGTAGPPRCAGAGPRGRWRKRGREAARSPESAGGGRSPWRSAAPRPRSTWSGCTRSSAGCTGSCGACRSGCGAARRVRRGGSVSSLLSGSRRFRPRRAGGPRCGEAPRPGLVLPEPRGSFGPSPGARASLKLSAVG